MLSSRGMPAQEVTNDPSAPDCTVEVSVVMPCLNEADTVATCIGKALRAMRAHGIAGEVVVADNGSTDASARIATESGARVVSVATRGYGSALMGGIAAASGRFIVMGDADDSYDFGEIPRFVERLREGYDLVQGCRLPAGGGRIMPGAMPTLHRWIGNPMFSALTRRWFHAVGIRDVYCGLRGFSRAFAQKLDQRCTGMEFAPEMIIRATLFGGRVTEVPITLHPDGRTAHARHLKTFRDGWRTLRIFLLYSPRRLFVIPGAALVALGLLGYAVALPGVTVGRLTFDAHTLLISSLAILCGYQALLFALFAKTFAVNEGFLPADRFLERFFRVMDLERGLALAGVALVAGVVLLVAAIDVWRRAGFGPLDYAHTMRLVVPGVTLFALGFQTVVSSFLVSFLGLARR